MSHLPRIFRHRTSLLIVTIALLGAIAGQWLYHSSRTSSPDLRELNATVFSSPRDVQPFRLLDHHGKAFTEASLAGEWSFVFFGYSNCPDVCPSTLTMLNLMLKALSKQSTEMALPRVMMVSIDPERDTVDQLAQYMPYFNPEFVGLTASSQAEIDILTRQFGIAYLLNKKSPDDKEYSVDHSGAVLLINPQGRLHALFSAPHDPITMANEFAIIRGAHE